MFGAVMMMGTYTYGEGTRGEKEGVGRLGKRCVSFRGRECGEGKIDGADVCYSDLDLAGIYLQSIYLCQK